MTSAPIHPESTTQAATVTAATAAEVRNEPSPSWGSRLAVVALGLELMSFCSLLAIYAVFRASHPEVVRAGLRWFGWGWGAAQLGVVVLGGLTAWIVLPRLRAAQGPAAMTLSAIVAIYGLAAIGLKGVEWGRWGGPRIVALAAAPTPSAGVATPAAAARDAKGDADAGAKSFGLTCASCHGAGGEGIPNVAPTLKASDFVRQSTDAQVRAVIASGRTAADPASKTGKVMPARGGNPFLSDSDITNIMAFLRSGGAPTAGGGASSPAPTAPRWVVPPAPAGPQGLSEIARLGPAEPQLPLAFRSQLPSDHERAFAPVAAAMSILHGLHLLVGIAAMVALVWLSYAEPEGGIVLARFARGYWLAAVLMWLILFPLVYLL